MVLSDLDGDAGVEKEAAGKIFTAISSSSLLMLNKVLNYGVRDGRRGEGKQIYSAQNGCHGIELPVLRNQLRVPFNSPLQDLICYPA